MSIFRRENIVNSRPNTVKWLYLHCNFQNFAGGGGGGGGGMPPDLLIEIPPSVIAVSIPKKKFYFFTKSHYKHWVISINGKKKTCFYKDMK